MAESPYTFRPYVKEDIPFIQNSWGSSYFKGGKYVEHLTPDEFHATHRPMRECFFMRPSAGVIVCAATSDPNAILGWLAFEKPAESKGIIIHYLYLKGTYRDEGIGTELLRSVIPNDGPVIYTHKTEHASKIMQHDRSKFRNFYYYPHLL